MTTVHAGVATHCTIRQPGVQCMYASFSRSQYFLLSWNLQQTHLLSCCPGNIQWYTLHLVWQDNMSSKEICLWFDLRDLKFLHPRILGGGEASHAAACYEIIWLVTAWPFLSLVFATSEDLFQRVSAPEISSCSYILQAFNWTSTQEGGSNSRAGCVMGMSLQYWGWVWCGNDATYSTGAGNDMGTRL